jgi:hypothetical protein
MDEGEEEEEEEGEEEEGMLDGGGGSGATKKKRLSSRGGDTGKTNAELVVCGKESFGDPKKRESKKKKESSAVDMTNVDATWALEDMPQGAQVVAPQSRYLLYWYKCTCLY